MNKRLKEVMVCGGVMATILFPFMVFGDKQNVKAEPQSTTVAVVEEVADVIEPTATVEEVTQQIVSIEEPTKVDMFTSATPLDEKLEKYIKSTAIEYQIEPALIFAVIKVESNFNVDCIGDQGRSIGLMQIQPSSWQTLANELGVNLYTPEGNVITGCAILNILSQKYNGDMEKVLKAYNSGNPHYPSNTYYDKVMKAYEEYK